MRDKEMLRQLETVCRLQQWLYSAPENSVTVSAYRGRSPKTRNMIDLRLAMNGEGTIMFQWRNGTNQPNWTSPRAYPEQLDQHLWAAVIEQLKKQPPVLSEIAYENRFEEIMDAVDKLHAED